MLLYELVIYKSQWLLKGIGFFYLNIQFHLLLFVSLTELSLRLPGETTPDKILLHSTVLAAMDPSPKENLSFSWWRVKRKHILLTALSPGCTGELWVQNTPETPLSAPTICHRPTLCHGYGHAHTHLWCLNLFPAVPAHQHTLLYYIIFHLLFVLFFPQMKAFRCHTTCKRF